MMNLFDHPESWKLSVGLCIVSLMLLALALLSHSVDGVFINVIAFIVNAACAVFKYSIRDILLKRRRQSLIDQTIGE
jgi:hypothetical protein